MPDSDTHQDSVTLERVLDAPIERVWKMWTDPECFKAWYGPAGATVPTAELDVRRGGGRRVCMAVGSMEMWFTGQHVEVTAPTRLVYTEEMVDEHGQPVAPESLGMPAGTPAVTQVTVALEQISSGTRLTLTHAGVSPDSGAAHGWSAALDKLATVLRTQTHS